MRDANFNARDFRNHRHGLSRQSRRPKIAAYALFKVSRLTDINNTLVAVNHSINPRPTAEIADEIFVIKRFGRL